MTVDQVALESHLVLTPLTEAPAQAFRVRWEGVGRESVLGGQSLPARHRTTRQNWWPAGSA